jgi:hypothetical protein
MFEEWTYMQAHKARVYNIPPVNLLYTTNRNTGNLISPLPVFCYNHRVQRVATAAFWRTFNHEGKISPGW